MSKTKILSAALATGLAATGADAARETPAQRTAGTDIVTTAADDILLFGGEALDDTDIAEILIGGPEDRIDVDDDDPELRMYLAQTIYGGGAGDVLSRPRDGNITLDNGIKRPKVITLDNGLKKRGNVKLKDRRGMRKGQRKKRN